MRLGWADAFVAQGTAAAEFPVPFKAVIDFARSLAIASWVRTAVMKLRVGSPGLRG